MADFKSSGTDTVVKIVLVFFISLLSFSIGTFVGKKFSDNQHKMVAMEPGKNLKDESAESTQHGDVRHSVGTAKHDRAKAAAGHETEALNDDQVAALEEEMITEEEFASTAPKQESIAEAPKLSKVLAKEMANHGAGKFTIQIASYPTQEEAEKRVNDLKGLKFDSFATEATIKGRQWYRVNVGMFATIREAQEHKALLAEKAKISTSIIQKLNK